MRRMIAKGLLLGSAVGVLLLVAADAEAIPAFARKYKVGCNVCRTVYPQLNRFGRDFRDNGFRMPDEVQALLKKNSSPVASHDPATGGAAAQERTDFWSFIPEEIPFSIQAKLHGVLNPKGDIKTDFQFEELQLQSGGTFTSRVSYYLHHHLAEEGEPGELYAGWLRFNNLFGSNWLNVTVGQSELPLSFSPEIERLSSFEYLVFDRELGTNTFNLNRPQLGVQVFGQSESGTKVWAGVANGSGLAVNEDTETFDNNSFKDVYARVGQEIGEHFIGGYAYLGRSRAGSAPGGVSNTFVRVGADAFVNLSKVTMSATALYARDDNPLGTGERRSFTGGFVEADLHLTERTVVLLRFDGVRQKLPATLESEKADEADEPLFRVNTFAFTPGVQFLVQPNVKLGFEYQVRQSRREDRGIVQFHVSF